MGFFEVALREHLRLDITMHSPVSPFSSMITHSKVGRELSELTDGIFMLKRVVLNRGPNEFTVFESRNQKFAELRTADDGVKRN